MSKMTVRASMLAGFIALSLPAAAPTFAASFAAQVVSELVRGDRKQIALERPALVVVWQARKKADERFLHYVFAGSPAP